MSCRNAGKRAAGVLAVVGAVALAAAGTAVAAPAVRVGDAAPFPAGATVLATSASAVSRPMAVTVALRPRHAALLRSYATEVGEPGSFYYRDYLTAAQFRARFAPTAATIRKVEAQMRKRGLKLAGVTANDLGIRLTGTGTEVERAFSLHFLHLRLADGRQALINAQAPAVAKSIAPAIGAVIGLNGMETQTTGLTVRRKAAARSPRIDRARPRTGGPVACKAADDATTGDDEYTRGAYTAAQIANRYGFSSLYHEGDKGQGVTVALYELEYDSPGDIAAYQSCYGTHTKITYVNVDGGPGKRALKNDPDGSGEAALDIEQLVSLVPKAKILVYRGPNASTDNPGSGPYDVYADAIGQDRAAVISTSWGVCEPVETYSDAAQEDVLFQEAAVQGQTITSAAGDDGSEDCDGLISTGADTLAVDDPASQPWVTGVGGTSLTLTATSAAESVWDNSLGAGGGGLSDFWAMPAYQRDAASSLGVVNADSGEQAGCSAATGWCREVPDVTASADPDSGYLNYFNGNGRVSGVPRGWIAVGGTSAAAPLWAALFALTDASKACDRVRIGFANPALYRIAGLGQSSYFFDITSGNNDFTGLEDGMFPALTGYDEASGLGSPRARYLAPALCGQAIKVTGARTRSYKLGAKVRLKLKAKLPSGTSARVYWHAHNLPAGLKLRYGVVSGKLRRAEVRDVVFTATADGSSSKVPAGYYGALAVTWTVKK